MNPYLVSSLAVGSINLALCLYVLYRNPNGPLIRPFTLLMIPLIGWPVTEIVLRSASNPATAETFSRISWAMVAYIPPAVLYFVHAFPTASPSRRELLWVPMLFVGAFALSLVISHTNYIIDGVVLNSWGYSAVRAKGFGLLAAYFCTLLAYGVITMLRKARRLGYPHKVSAEYVSIGITIPMVAGSLTHLVFPQYGIDVIPIASLSTLAISVLVGRQAVKYQRRQGIQSIPDNEILDSLSDAVFVVDEEATILSVNRAMVRMLGYSEEELLDRPLESIIDEEQTIFMAGWTLDEHGLKDQSLTWLTKSGEKIPVSLTTSPLRPRTGSFSGFVGVARDTRTVATLEQMVKSSMGQLKESQGKYRTLVEKSLEGIYIIQDNKFTFANERFQEMTGYTAEELTQMNFWEIVAPDSADLVRERAFSRLRGETPPERYEFKAVTKNGRILDVEAQATTIEYEGQPAIQVYLRDNTENKDLREKLSALYQLSSELSLSLSLEQVHDRVLRIVSDVLHFDNCAILFLNEKTNELSIEAQMGYPKDVEAVTIPLAGSKGVTAEVARTCKPLYVPDVTKDERYVQGIPGARSEVAIPLAVKNRVLGVLNLESEQADAFTEQDIQLLGALAYHASVAIQTSRLFQKISEKAAELSAVIEIAKAVTSSVHMEVLKPTVLEELKNAIPYDLAGLFLYDVQQGRLVLAAQEGLSVDEAREREETAMERHPGKVFNSKRPLLVEDVSNDPRVSYKEGMPAPASLLYVPLVFQDKALGVIAMASFEKSHFDERHLRLAKAIASEVAIAIENAHLVKDLATAKFSLEELNRELEEKVIERTRELQDTQDELLRKEKLATLGQLAGSVAHELRNPLAVIRNSLYCINHRLPKTDEKIVRHYDIINRQISRSDEIIEDLLEYSRTKVAVKRQILLKRFAESVLGNLTVPDNIEVVTKLDDHLPEVECDEGQIARVISNIISNALEAMPDGGELTVQSLLVGEHPVLRIQDTGIGIPEENLERIWQPLFSTKVRGIGLGLALARDLAGVNGVKIEVESYVGKGSTFSLCFVNGSAPERREDYDG